MGILLITGAPGAGKSLFAVKYIVETLAPTGRRILTNIDGFDASTLENVETCGDEMPLRWQSEPDGTIFVFDEVQRQYPFKNSASAVPEYITGYETHRHRGFDFVFVTQGPYLLNRHLFPLIERHIHVYRPFGLGRATLLEWNGVNKEPQPNMSRSNALVRNFSFPSRYFRFYRSATMHTVRKRVPVKLVAFLVFVLALFALVVFLVVRVVSGRLADPQTIVESAGSDRECFSLVGFSGSSLVVSVSGAVFRLPRSALGGTPGALSVTLGAEKFLACES